MSARSHVNSASAKPSRARAAPGRAGAGQRRADRLRKRVAYLGRPLRRRDLAVAQSEITSRLARTVDAEIVRDAGRRIELEGAA